MNTYSELSEIMITMMMMIMMIIIIIIIIITTIPHNKPDIKIYDY